MICYSILFYSILYYTVQQSTVRSRYVCVLCHLEQCGECQVERTEVLPSNQSQQNTRKWSRSNMRDVRANSTCLIDVTQQGSTILTGSGKRQPLLPRDVFVSLSPLSLGKRRHNHDAILRRNARGYGLQPGAKSSIDNFAHHHQIHRCAKVNAKLCGKGGEREIDNPSVQDRTDSTTLHDTPTCVTYSAKLNSPPWLRA